jgi:hypothetical protein
MHATNTFPVDRHPQYRHHLTTIHSIASGIIIEVKKTTSLTKYLSLLIPHFDILLHTTAHI